jgi:Ca2+-binding RTX toxin-like protein
MIFEDAGGGYDTVEVDYSYSIADIEIEALYCFGDQGSQITLTGNDLNNVIVSGSSDDTVHGAGGDDRLMSGHGNDVLNGDAGSDALFGGGGNDRLNGGEGADELHGEWGDDVLVGGAGIDQFVGGAGNDTYVIDDASERITEKYNEGIDTVIVDFNYSLEYREYLENLSVASTRTTHAVDLTGNYRDNVLTGNAGTNRLTGGYGKDTLYGGGGADILNGGQGEDVLSGGADADTFTFVAGDGKDVVTDLAAGDVVRLSSYHTAQSVTQVGSDVVVVLSDTDQITFRNTTLETVQSCLRFEGKPPPQRLVGTPGNDTLIGGAGDDTLLGYAGNDILDGGAGSDWMTGGTGDDIYYVNEAGDRVNEQWGEGIDTIRSSAANYELPWYVENGILEGTAALNLTGNHDDNRLEGNSAANRLFGAEGNDTLLGGAGNDLLNGGAGNDRMTGGTGADTFQFQQSWGTDTITDFQSGVDKLDLSLLGVTSENVQTRMSKGSMQVRVDVNNDGRADLTISLVGVTNLDMGDFLF